MTITPTTLPFNATHIGETTSSQTFEVSGSNLSGNITITPPSDYRISRNNTTFTNQPIVLSRTGTSVAPTTIYVQFAPTQTGARNQSIVLTTANPNGPQISRTVTVTGEGEPAITSAITFTNNPMDFGTVSTNGSGTRTSIVTATGLAPNSTVTLTPQQANVRFRLFGTGAYVNTPITLTTNASGNVTQEIQVQLVGTPSGPFTGQIVAEGVTPGNTTAMGTLNIVANGLTGNSAINASGALSLFSTVPGVPSAVQTYQLSGTNLLEGVDVQAPLYYQVGLSVAALEALGNTTGNTITIPRNSGNDLTVTTVYIRYLPPTAREDATVITHTSSPANPVTFPVSGTSRPQVEITNAFTNPGLIIINNKSSVQNLNFTAARVRQPITISISNTSPSPQNPGGTPQFELSTDGVNFAPTATYTPNATTYDVNAPLYVRYAPTYLGQASNNLRFKSTDFAITTEQDFVSNGQLSGRSIDTQPTAERPFLLTRSGSTITVSYIGSVAGQGEGHLIVASENSSLPTNRQPVDGVSYQTNNSIYGSGPTLAPGYFVVYAGANTQQTIEGFDKSKSYYFYSFEFNNIDPNTGFITQTAENYLTPTVAEQIEGIVIVGEPLPVTLAAFSVKLQNKQVNLNWATATEVNNKGFEVQRSADAKNFQTIDFVAGNGSSTNKHEYKSTDKNPLSGTAYYRLKQIDLDGKFAYTEVKTVVNGEAGSLSVYPNPVQSNVTVKLPVIIQNARVQVLDLTGRVVLNRTLAADGNLQLGELQRGTYLVRVEQGGQNWTQRIVKQ
ncbi:T9SS type A sorting domain-containing protein [Hymenobacter sp. J193]|uniref:T9SS type A sorting domain-containing protein n=1 Tax=Hymenobacter sp. J193 TaxID=2898429 RepID=UPI00215188AD|nr:T9SS type A sorting domain-containing protein [Hymenobacter sp. J193]MCR5886728.1 T9SS type A sorting domain-containing protein [Hymenobacter sp. J193]